MRSPQTQLTLHLVQSMKETKSSVANEITPTLGACCSVRELPNLDRDRIPKGLRWNQQRRRVFDWDIFEDSLSSAALRFLIFALMVQDWDKSLRRAEKESVHDTPRQKTGEPSRLNREINLWRIVVLRADNKAPNIQGKGRIINDHSLRRCPCG